MEYPHLDAGTSEAGNSMTMNHNIDNTDNTLFLQTQTFESVSEKNVFLVQQTFIKLYNKRYKSLLAHECRIAFKDNARHVH